MDYQPTTVVTSKLNLYSFPVNNPSNGRLHQSFLFHSKYNDSMTDSDTVEVDSVDCDRQMSNTQY